MSRTGVSPIHQHEVDQPAMLVNGPEQVLPVATDLHIRLVHSPRGRTVPLVPADPLLKLRRVAMNPAHDRGRIHVYAAFLHHLRQIPVAYPIFAVPANTHQDDIHVETTALEHEQGSSANHSRYDTPVNTTDPFFLASV